MPPPNLPFFHARTNWRHLPGYMRQKISKRKWLAADVLIQSMADWLIRMLHVQECTK